MTNRTDYETRRAIVNAIIDETKDHGDAIRPLNCERWDDITIDEYEPHCPVITGEIIIDLYDLADLILDTIGREPSDRSPVGVDSHVSEPLELLTDETGIIAANQR
ncbi:hypothetical protein [Bifidobacterium breve]|uniref:Uncharacterized protein n=1 Tax=Bifidobacterium breve TaxID=1685 RepID=A0A2K9BA76_BIFBR|nr:hypothetical protein [Bifidobacterium breve]AUE03587.1 Hypothetical protein BB215W447A_1579 [Bifidobacterium breve]AUE05627.1 hypothetical protein CNCMI4321_1416 [Bifidobacterium breve]AUE21050.1 hypothetical protein DRBB30_1414 [Bifidobacterium breve]